MSNPFDAALTLDDLIAEKQGHCEAAKQEFHEAVSRYLDAERDKQAAYDKWSKLQYEILKLEEKSNVINKVTV